MQEATGSEGRRRPGAPTVRPLRCTRAILASRFAASERQGPGPIYTWRRNRWRGSVRTGHHHRHSPARQPRAAAARPQSSKLANVCYDIRGPVLEKARQMEEEGQHIIKLNIGNIAAFGLEPPDEIVQDMIRNLPNAAGYTDSKGLFAPRKAIVHYTPAKARQGRDRRRRLPRQRRVRADHDEHERAAQRRRRGADPGARLPALDGVGGALGRHAGALPVRRSSPTGCPTSTTWRPRSRRARARIVVINPNNPTGALYPDDAAREDRRAGAPARLIVFADEIYDKTLYDGATTPRSPRWPTTCCSSPSTACRRTTARAATAPAGWSSRARSATPGDYIEGLGMLASMRLCSNTPGQLAIQTALGGYQSIDDLVAPGGRLAASATSRYELLTAIPGVTCVKPKAALYMFPRLDPEALSDRRRPAVRLRAAGRAEGADRPGHRLQLAAARSLPRRLPAQLRRPTRGDRPHRDLPDHYHAARRVTGAAQLPQRRSW